MAYRTTPGAGARGIRERLWSNTYGKGDAGTQRTTHGVPCYVGIEPTNDIYIPVQVTGRCHLKAAAAPFPTANP